LQGLNDALAALPVEQRQAYQTAVARAQRIVELETPPERFLQANQMDFWTAAGQLTLYWTQRREIFGEDYYCKPLVLLKTENPSPDENPYGVNFPSQLSALSNQIISEIFERGTVHISPWSYSGDHTVDADNHPYSMNQHEAHLNTRVSSSYCSPILTYDRNNLLDEEFGRSGDDKVRAKMAFYILHVLSETPMAMDPGFVSVFVSEEGNKIKPKPDDSSSKLLHIKALPVKFRAVHLLSGQNTLLGSLFVSRRLDILRRWAFFHFRARVHRFQSSDEAITDMANYGVGKTHLPERFGGTCNGKDWFQNRRAMDQKRYSFLTLLKESAVASVAAIVARKCDCAPCNNPSLPADQRMISCIYVKQEYQQIQSTGTKRQRESLQDWAAEHLHKYKIAKIQTEIQIHEQERNELKKQEEFLESRLACSRYLADQYDRDLRAIHECLKSLVVPLFVQYFGRDALLPIMNQLFPNGGGNPSDERVQSALAGTIIKTFLVFRGRAPNSGEWMFTSTPALPGYNLWTKAQEYLLSEQKRLQKEDECKRQICLPELLSSSENDDDESLERKLGMLNDFASYLSAQNRLAQERQDFLNSSVVCARHTSDAFGAYKKKKRALVAMAFASVLTASLASETTAALSISKSWILDDKYQEDPTRKRVFRLADGALECFTSFDHSGKMANPAVILAQQLMTALETRDGATIGTPAAAESTTGPLPPNSPFSAGGRGHASSQENEVAASEKRFSEITLCSVALKTIMSLICSHDQSALPSSQNQYSTPSLWPLLSPASLGDSLRHNERLQQLKQDQEEQVKANRRRQYRLQRKKLLKRL